MTIKELEERTGLLRANIRFYEEEGLLSPVRLANGYRDYSEEDVLTLEKIKLLRQLQLDINTIRLVQGGTLTLEQAMFSQLNKLEGDRALIERAAELGSDTAFFVRNTPQLCEGRGEVMTPIEIDIKGRWLVLIKPDESVSTREAYAGVRPAVPERRLTERVAEPIERWQGSVKNDFEESVFKAHPALARIKEELLESGAVYAAMSGSGSTIFGIFDSEQKAKRWSEQTQYIYKM